MTQIDWLILIAVIVLVAGPGYYWYGYAPRRSPGYAAPGYGVPWLALILVVLAIFWLLHRL